MAYSNWGAFVYKAGERQTSKEDVPPFGDADVEAVPSGARIWVSLLKAKAAGTLQDQKPWERCHHAVLGSGPVRLCGYKHYPQLFVVDETGPRKVDLDLTKWWDDAAEEMSGEVLGHAWRATPCDNAVDLWLREPDGTEWTGHCGFERGAGFDE